MTEKPHLVVRSCCTMCDLVPVVVDPINAWVVIDRIAGVRFCPYCGTEFYLYTAKES